MACPGPEREWRKALDAHAAQAMADLIAGGCEGLPFAAPGPLVDGRPSVDIRGPDGEWRRYLVRLTEAPTHAPFDATQWRALRP